MAINPVTRKPPERSDSASRRRCAAAIGYTVRAGAERYDRGRHLPWLARVMPVELESDDPVVTEAIIARLERTLRAERRRGKAGHWTYDMNRHIALMQALRAERQRLKAAGIKSGEIECRPK
jgi:hypothetical protein